LDGDLMRASQASIMEVPLIVLFLQSCIWWLLSCMYVISTWILLSLLFWMEGHPHPTMFKTLQGIHLEEISPGPGVLELVRYSTDVEKQMLKIKSGRVEIKPLTYVAYICMCQDQCPPKTMMKTPYYHLHWWMWQP
jgi:hypothetical protein